MNKNNQTKELNIKELFSEDTYVIPIYQRNYDWGNYEITQLIQDIVDYSKEYKNELYYIGTLITYKKKLNGEDIFETIDGQQRLTTLTIILNIIKNEYSDSVDMSWYKKINLKFDSRKISTDTLQFLFDGESLEEKNVNTSIIEGYEDAKKALHKILEDFNLSINDFCDYLFNKVYILRVLVPEDTDLNHYFEIMNNRGEQLEKHEILKAKCLKILNEEDRYIFNSIWEACSDMGKYVQYGFDSEKRKILFGENLNTLISKENLYFNFKDIKLDSTKEENKKSIKDLLKNNSAQSSNESTQKDEIDDRFNSVINFSNFLLHVLRIQTKKDIALDDKRLLVLFEPFLKDENKAKSFIKEFGYTLLKSKFLFDKYIIKREFKSEKDEWSLKKIKLTGENKNISYVNSFGDEDSNEGENRGILMLLSMFYVSNPTPVYNHWLNAALKYIFENYNKPDFNANSYKNYLEKLAKAFLWDRYLAKKPKDYFEIIYTNNAVPKNRDIDEEKLNQGTAVENFIFNYLDYLLWKKYKNNDKEYFIIEGREINDDRIKNFKYTIRNSIEHYYPQHPIEGNPTIEDKWLNHFGNLCLISRSKNSRLSNYMPNAKKEHYQNSPTIDSIKQRIMMEYENWDIDNAIKEHGRKMKDILLNE